MDNVAGFNIANVFSYLRAVSGLSQEGFGSQIGWSKYKVSRVENGLNIPDIDEMTIALESDLLKPFNLTYHSFIVGKVNINSNLLEFGHKDNFQIPKKYKDFSNTRGKLLRIYVDNFIRIYGVKGYASFCKSERVSPSYFVNVNNDVNMLFVQRMLQELRKKDFLATDLSISNFCSSISDSVAVNSEVVRLKPSPLEKVVGTIEDIATFEENHTYSVSDINTYNKSIVISAAPKEHISWDLWAKDPLIGGLAEKLIGNIMQGIAGHGYEWSMIESVKDGGKNCKIQITQKI